MAAKTMWINHLELLSGNPSVKTSCTSAPPIGFGGCLIIESSTTGATAGGFSKFLSMGVQVPPGYLIKGVRLCYQLSNKRSFIDEIRLAQVQTPPSGSSAVLDDGTAQTNPGPVCVNSKPTNVDPSLGAIVLSLRVNFGNTSDKIAVSALGLLLEAV